MVVKIDSGYAVVDNVDKHYQLTLVLDNNGLPVEKSKLLVPLALAREVSETELDLVIDSAYVILEKAYKAIKKSL